MIQTQTFNLIVFNLKDVIIENVMFVKYLLIFIASFVLVACNGGAATDSTTDLNQDSNNGVTLTGQQIEQQYCQSCHFSKVGTRFTQSQWDSTITRMINQNNALTSWEISGLSNLTSIQRQALIDYLVQNAN